MAAEAPWKPIALKKQQQRASRIPEAWRISGVTLDSKHNDLPALVKSCGLLTDKEFEITQNATATGLIRDTAQQKVKTIDVVTAFCKRAAIAHQLTNCLTEIFFDDAIKRAKELDEHMARTGKPMGPLHGLPISLKDSYRVKGYDSSLGMAILCFKENTFNSVMVDLLLKAGAVLYCKTNLPHTLMALDSDNNIFGRVLNPAHPRLTAGGSSGGEGALIAMRGSILGIGTDVGGSIRVPAMCNGLYGFKPSHGRIPYALQEYGVKQGTENMIFRASAGPIAHNIPDCELLFKVVSDMRVWEMDPEVVPQAWETQPTLQASPAEPNRLPDRIRIGVVRTDGVSTPLPPINKMMDELVAKFSSHRESTLPVIEMVEMDISPLLSRCQPLANALFGVFGNNNWLNMLAEFEEPIIPWLEVRMKRKPRLDIEQVRDLHGARNMLQIEFLKIWKSDGGFWTNYKQKTNEVVSLDGIIFPVAPHPTPEINRWNTASYTSSFVLMDYPAATIPVRKLVPADLKGEINHEQQPIGGWDAANRKLWDEVDREVYLGTQLSVQLVGQKLYERKFLAVMTILDNIIKAEYAKDKSNIAAQL